MLSFSLNIINYYRMLKSRRNSKFWHKEPISIWSDMYFRYSRYWNTLMRQSEVCSTHWLDGWDMYPWADQCLYLTTTLSLVLLLLPLLYFHGKNCLLQILWILVWKPDTKCLNSWAMWGKNCLKNNTQEASAGSATSDVLLFCSISDLFSFIWTSNKASIKPTQ